LGKTEGGAIGQERAREIHEGRLVADEALQPDIHQTAVDHLGGRGVAIDEDRLSLVLGTEQEFEGLRPHVAVVNGLTPDEDFFHVSALAGTRGA
jgi:hypothetical protein